MALIKELLRVLDDDDEPLPKRLKIADNAFTSVELPIHHREVLLIRWLTNVAKDCRSEVWTLFHDWLQSEQFKQLNRSDISHADVTFLIELVSNTFVTCKNVQPDVKKLFVDVFVAIIENRIFQQYFKFDVKAYCQFVSDVLGNLDSIDFLIPVLKNNNLFHKSYMTNKFSKYFVDVNLPTLCKIVEKFNSEIVFDEASKLLQKCVFQKNMQEFVSYFDQVFEKSGESHTPKLIKILQNTNDKTVFKLVVNSFCKAFNDFPTIYKFTIILHEILSFDLTQAFDLQIDECVPINGAENFEILANVYEILARTKHTNCALHDTTFLDFVQRVVLTMMQSSGKPNVNMFRIINSAIAINPLIVEPIVTDVLAFVMSHDNLGDEYESLVVKIFDVFAKLHRVRKLISKMISAFKRVLNSDWKPIENVYKFRGEFIKNEPKSYEIKYILPDKVLDSYSGCVTALGRSKLVGKLFKMLLMCFDGAVTDNLQKITEDHKKVVYLEMLSTLLCHFMSSVKITEHTAHDFVAERFMKKMNTLKEILGKFGTTLVTIEHSLTIMRLYLNTCYTWGELYIAFCYYSTNKKISLDKSSNNDYSACNITYVHSYLTTEQWCLISQRITNFGEKPCKQIMHNLFTQRLKCILLFENAINEEIANSYVKDLSLDDYWDGILRDSFVLNTISIKLHKTHIVSLADFILKSGDKSLLTDINILDQRFLVNALMLRIIAKINKIFKKHETSSVKMYKKINEDVFLENSDSVGEVVDYFSKMSDKKIDGKINEEKLIEYLEIVKALPVTYMSNDVQLVVFLYLASVLNDLNAFDKNTKQLENILTGMLASGCFVGTINLTNLIRFVTKNFSNYATCFEHVFAQVRDDLKQFTELVGYLTDNLDCNRCLQCIVMLINKTNEIIKQRKLTPEDKSFINECNRTMCKALIALVTSVDGKHSKDKLIFPYAVVLKDCLLKNSEDLSVLSPHLQNYIDCAIDDIEGKTDTTNGVKLFTTILYNKSKLTDIKDDFVIKIWNLYKDARISNEDFKKDTSKLFVLIFEHISQKEFPDIIDDLLTMTRRSLNDKNYDDFSQQIRIWNSVLTCNFNPVKLRIWTQALETLMQETMEIFDDAAFADEFVDFEVHILQTTHVCLKIFDLNHSFFARLMHGATSRSRARQALVAHNSRTDDEYQLRNQRWSADLLLPYSVIDIMFVSISFIMSSSKPFPKSFSLSISILENLLKYRNPLIADRLPSYLQQYRTLLVELCKKSNSDVQLDVEEIHELSNCAHRLLKLTTSLVKLDKHLSRISMYLIADVLRLYETITLYPSVKLHVNNCVYQLMSLCDQHATSFLLRVLSMASTEIFKFMYENYKKYYRFTGKV